MTECRTQSFGSYSQTHCTLIEGLMGCPARLQSSWGPQMAECLPIALPFEWTESPHLHATLWTI